MSCSKRQSMLRLGVLSATMIIALTGIAGGTASAAERPPNAPTSPELPSSQGRQPGQVSPFSTSQCGSQGWYCAWQDANWAGSFWAWYTPINQWFYVGSGANDRISSDWNRNTHGTYVAANYPAGTYQYCTTAGGSHSLVGYYPQPPYPSANDSISAVYIANFGC